MLTLTLIALHTPALAGETVSGGVQAAVYEDGLDFAEELLNGQVFDLSQSEVASENGCYDRLGVRDFNLNVPVENINAQLTRDGLAVQMDFGTIRGEDMILFGEDEELWDTCISFELDLYYAVVTNGRLEATILPTVTDGDLAVEFVGTPLLEGELETDTAIIPDGVVLYFFEDTIWEILAETSKALLVGLVDSYWQAGLLSGEFYDLELNADLRDASVSEDALLAGADLTANWIGEAVCIPGEAGETNDKEPEIDFGNGFGSSVGLGMTEGNLNRTLRELWEDGYLCFPDERMDLIYQMATELFDPSVAGLQAEAVIETEPVITITKSGAAITIDAFSLGVKGEIDGVERDIIGAEGSLSGRIDLALDPVLTALSVSLHDMELDLSRFDAEHLVSDSPNAEEHLRDFIEGWLLEWVVEELEQISLFNTQFDAFGAIARVDNIEWQRDALLVLASLYLPDDPAVDRVAPETEIEGMELQPLEGKAVLRFSGSDDRSGDLGYSHRVNGGSWSSWSTEKAAKLEDLLPGTHVFEVKAKDSWLNEDTTPAEIGFEMPELEPDAVPEEAGLANCNCASTPQGPRGVLGAGLALALLVGARRRRAE
ncbi:MAG: hypothetical protein VXW32_05650 [Myxococcota bacterium]|nr:hypothetical protein [Myxococcota bacterium]